MRMWNFLNFWKSKMDFHTVYQNMDSRDGGNPVDDEDKNEDDADVLV